MDFNFDDLDKLAVQKWAETLREDATKQRLFRQLIMPPSKPLTVRQKLILSFKEIWRRITLSWTVLKGEDIYADQKD